MDGCRFNGDPPALLSIVSRRKSSELITRNAYDKPARQWPPISVVGREGIEKSKKLIELQGQPFPSPCCPPRRKCFSRRVTSCIETQELRSFQKVMDLRIRPTFPSNLQLDYYRSIWNVTFFRAKCRYYAHGPPPVAIRGRVKKQEARGAGQLKKKKKMPEPVEKMKVSGATVILCAVLMRV